MTKYNTAHQYWTEVTDRLMSSKEEYAKFLKFSSGIYKHDFTDAAMIYRQNPNATKVAELETWNRLGRRVNRGEHSIVTFGQGIKCKYLFDVTQTHGKKEPDLWTLDDKLSDRLLSEINKKNGLECKNLNEAISKLCFLTMKQINSDGDYPDSYDGFSLDEKKKFNRSILSSARYIISNRCMLNGDITLDTSLNLEGLDLCKTRNDFAEFGNLAHSTAKSALLYMERELLQIMKQIKKEERHLSEDISEKNKVREIPFSVGSTFEIEGTYYKVDEIDIAKDNVRLSALGSDTAYTRSMDIDELSMFYTQKQIEEKAVDSAIDDILNNNNEIIIENTPVEVNPEIAPLTDENLIAEIIKYGDTRYERNESIANFFNDNQDLDLRAGYISSLYRDETAQFKINGIDVGFEKTEKGLTVWQGTSENREYQSVLSWECVQAIIGKSIEEEKFIDIKKSTAEEIKDIYTSDSEHDIEAFFNNNAVDMTELSAVTEGRRIRCETQDEAEQLFDYLRDNGYTWYDGDTLTRTDWFYAENNTFYTINDDTKTIDRGDSSVYEAYELKRMDIEDFSDVKNDFVSGSKFREPEETAEKKYDLYFHIEKNGVNVYDSSDNIDEPIAVIDSDRNVTVNTELPKSVIENIREYADGMADIYVLPEIRKARSDEPTVKILYAETPCALYQGLTMPFSQADEIFKAVDDNHVNARNNKISGEKYIGYSKVEFEITGGSDNPDFVYKGRYDVGDGENGLFNHIKNNYEYFRSEDYSKYVNAESYEDYQRELDELEKNILPYLEIHLNYEKNLQNQLSTPTMPEWSAYTQYINDVQIAQIGRKIDDSKPLYSGNVEYCSGIFSNDNENGYNVDFAKNLAKKLNENGITDLAEASEFVKSKAIDFKHLGTSENTGYYYFSDRLSRNSLSVIKEKAERYVIAAPSCIISDEQLSDYNISFVKTDRDIPAEIFKGDSNKAMEEMKRFADGLSENTEVSENIFDNLTEIDPETAIYMWQDGFDVYVGDTKLNPYDNSYRNDNETGYDLITHGGEICKANNDDIQHYKELDSLAERIDRLQNRVSSDFSLSDYADVEEDYVFDWNNEQTNYQNIEKSLSTNNVEYISVWLNDLKYPDNSGDDDLSEEAILISESLDEYKSKYITPTVQEISEQAKKNNE